MDELDPRERAVLVNLLDQAGVCGDVRCLPDPPLDVVTEVVAVVDLDLLGAHDRPTALGLHPSHDGVGGRIAMAHPVAVRDLEEAVARHDRPNRHGLEEDVVAGLSHRLLRS